MGTRGRRTSTADLSLRGGSTAASRKVCAAITDLEVLRTLEGARFHPSTPLATRVLALTPAWLDQIRLMRWTDVDRQTCLILGACSGTAPHFLVPLSRQVLDAIRALRQINGSSGYVLPSHRARNESMRADASDYVLRRVDYRARHRPEGWRHSFATIMAQRPPAYREILDGLLRQVPVDAVKSAAARASQAERRRRIAQEWADLLLREFPHASQLLPGAHH